MDKTISIALIFSGVAMLSQIYTIWTTYKKAQSENEQKNIEVEKNFIKLELKLDDFQNNISLMFQNLEKHTVKLEQISNELIKCNERIATLFKYKDDHELRIKHLEGKD